MKFIRNKKNGDTQGCTLFNSILLHYLQQAYTIEK